MDTSLAGEPTKRTQPSCADPAEYALGIPAGMRERPLKLKKQGGLKDCCNREQCDQGRGQWMRKARKCEGEKEWKMNSWVEKHQGRKGERPCNFSNPPGIYAFTRQIMKMENKMEKLPLLHRRHGTPPSPFFFFFLICCTTQL